MIPVQFPHHTSSNVRRSSAPRIGAVALAVCADVLAIVASALVTGCAWHLVVHDTIGPVDLYLRSGFSVAVVFTLAWSQRPGHVLEELLGRDNGRLFATWNAAFLALLVVAFLANGLDEFSRGFAVLFYPTGYLALAGTRALTGRLLRIAGLRVTGLSRRVALVGSTALLRRLPDAARLRAAGFEVVTLVHLDSPCEGDPGAISDEAIASGVSIVRQLECDEVLLAVPWNEACLSRCLDAFLEAPAAIRLVAPDQLARITQVSRFETRPLPGLLVASSPAGIATQATKRVLDVFVAASALFLLAPLLALLAVAIRLDTPGPVLFLQTRLGFNRRPFRILKFRTMSVMEDGAQVRQATRDDPRVTRVGRFLRRNNLDELPQLWNVLVGEMSLVGPRPHAIAHDADFEKRVALYARRHNVKPGITGWAQVHGLRGEIDTPEKLRRRVEFDLFYIDNCSLALDLRILALTLSPRVFMNAY